MDYLFNVFLSALPALKVVLFFIFLYILPVVLRITPGMWLTRLLNDEKVLPAWRRAMGYLAWIALLFGLFFGLLNSANTPKNAVHDIQKQNDSAVSEALSRPIVPLRDLWKPSKTDAERQEHYDGLFKHMKKE